jgi:hypothetical protein
VTRCILIDNNQVIASASDKPGFAAAAGAKKAFHSAVSLTVAVFARLKAERGQRIILGQLVGRVGCAAQSDITLKVRPSNF